MKIVLSVVLILLGLYMWIKQIQINRRDKEMVLKITVANYIIAKDALTRSDLEPEKLMDATDHLTENTMNIILLACGSKYIEEADWMMKDYDSKHDE